MSTPELEPGMAGATLFGRRLLARNAVLNLAGFAAPMVVAVVAIPILIPALGVERFGVLTLAWMVIGYFSVFDLGIGRALTQRVAVELGAGREDRVPAVARAAIGFMLAIGIVGALTLASLAPWLATRALQIPTHLQAESVGTFRILALSLPFVTATAGLRGLLEAKQRFGLINLIRVPLGVFTFLGPVLVLPFSDSLVPIVAVLVAGRVVGSVAHLVLCGRMMPALLSSPTVEADAIPSLLRMGGWMTVSNVVSPLMTYLDRFLIGAMVTMTAVAYYVTPYEVVTKLWIIPSALLGVLFPAFAGSFAMDRRRTIELMDQGVRATLVVLFPLVLLIVALAPEGLGLWVGPEFARESALVLQLLAAGVFINSVGQLPFSTLQAIGRPDITGKLHLLELPVYIAALWWLIATYGIVGAAIAWLLRVTIDTVALFTVSNRLLHIGGAFAWRTGASMVAAVATLGVATLPQTLGGKLLFLVVAAGAFTVGVWRGVLAHDERAFLVHRVRFRVVGR